MRIRYKVSNPASNDTGLERCGEVTERATIRGRNLCRQLLDDRGIMTTIAADGVARGSKESANRLSIIANCCKYAVRFDT